MIHVSRGVGPRILIDVDGAGRRELAKALKLFKRKLSVAVARKRKQRTRAGKPRGGRAHASFSFTAYKDDSVKVALEALFHGKCAYCENRYAGVHPVDVEHWRPKAAVVVASDDMTGKRPPHPGYYWLAAEWANLLPSCIDCNRGRTQLELPSGEKRNLGKANQFPLRDEAKRAYRPEETAREEPLLLNPCDDRPEAYFEFARDTVLIPKRDATMEATQRAVASIRVYALNRVGLVDDRKTAFLQIAKEQSDVQKLVGMLDSHPTGPLASRLQEMLSSKIVALIETMASKKTFALMARQSIVPFLDSLTSGAAGPALQRSNWAGVSAAHKTLKRRN